VFGSGFEGGGTGAAVGGAVFLSGFGVFFCGMGDLGVVLSAGTAELFTAGLSDVLAGSLPVPLLLGVALFAAGGGETAPVGFGLETAFSVAVFAAPAV
jgi:hypothetical protein